MKNLLVILAAICFVLCASFASACDVQTFATPVCATVAAAAPAPLYVPSYAVPSVAYAAVPVVQQQVIVQKQVVQKQRVIQQRQVIRSRTVIR